MRDVMRRAAFADVTVFDSEEVVWQAMEDGIYENTYDMQDPVADELYRGRIVGSMPGDLVVFFGVEVGDTGDDATYLADKVCGLRIFEDNEGRMNRSLLGFSETYALAVSQFTLLGDARKGRRPSFTAAEKPEQASCTAPSWRR
jgi:D-tyrosyl-tRNA(Tyr) deacylase